MSVSRTFMPPPLPRRGHGSGRFRAILRPQGGRPSRRQRRLTGLPCPVLATFRCLASAGRRLSGNDAPYQFCERATLVLRPIEPLPARSAADRLLPPRALELLLVARSRTLAKPV